MIVSWHCPKGYRSEGHNSCTLCGSDQALALLFVPFNPFAFHPFLRLNRLKEAMPCIETFPPGPASFAASILCTCSQSFHSTVSLTIVASFSEVCALRRCCIVLTMPLAFSPLLLPITNKHYGKSAHSASVFVVFRGLFLCILCYPVCFCPL